MLSGLEQPPVKRSHQRLPLLRAAAQTARSPCSHLEARAGATRQRASPARHTSPWPAYGGNTQRHSLSYCWRNAGRCFQAPQPLEIQHGGDALTYSAERGRGDQDGAAPEGLHSHPTAPRPAPGPLRLFRPGAAPAAATTLTCSRLTRTQYGAILFTDKDEVARR